MKKNTEVATAIKKEKIVIYFLSSGVDQDIEDCKTLVSYIKPFTRNTKPAIEILTDRAEIAGTNTDEIKQRLFEADLVIALASKDFLDDDDIYERLKKVIVRYNNKETDLVGILLRHCLWHIPLFGTLPKIPKVEHPIYDEKFWKEEEKAFTVVAEELIKEIKTHYSVEEVAL
jgi:hypothetical protein